jgi:hypothetical protein
MKAADVLHGLLRHTCAHHRRETISFGRRVNAGLERMMLTMVWRNFVKEVIERRKDRQWAREQVFSKRVLPARVNLPPGWMNIYRRKEMSPGIGYHELQEKTSMSHRRTMTAAALVVLAVALLVGVYSHHHEGQALSRHDGCSLCVLSHHCFADRTGETASVAGLEETGRITSADPIAFAGVSAPETEARGPPLS